MPHAIDQSATDLVNQQPKELPPIAPETVRTELPSETRSVWEIDLPKIDVQLSQNPKALSAEQIVAIQKLVDELDAKKKKDEELARLKIRILARTQRQRVYFFTNRMLIKKPEKANPWFRIFDFYPGLKDGYRAQSIHTGWVDVHTPSAQRVKGRLSVPRGLPGRIGDEAFVATDRYTLWQGDEVSQMINELWDQSVLLYIHGFNHDFSEAVTRAAQLKVDLAWDGAVVAVDWPSAGMGGAYAIDW